MSVLLTISLYILAVGRDEEGVLQIKCAFCDVIITFAESVNSLADVDRLHYSLKPDCPFMRGRKEYHPL